MSEQSRFPMLFPFTLGAEAWRKAWSGADERTKAVLDEVARVEAQGMQHARTMLDESLKMTHETFGYVGQLTSEWRRLSLEMTRRTGEMLTPPAAK